MNSKFDINGQKYADKRYLTLLLNPKAVIFVYTHIFSRGSSQCKNMKLIYLIVLPTHQNVFSEGPGSYTNKC